MGKNISVHFKEDELSLLDDFSILCKENFTTKSGEIKKHIRDLIRQDIVSEVEGIKRYTGKCPRSSVTAERVLVTS